ncbi:hypothetical protein [Streptomyces sp. CRN 30]|uniref:anti-sigma factor family protein n=1 Tax=Streptomyces sp. CRN 30 TaxID=3075613 RepID=UPI002A81EBA3|nr:hypothetical protein [Streptomyces sp. CRN 30]
MARHPDVTEISDLAEGLLPPSQTTDVRRHLDACELCADVYASLEEIRGLLGTLPGPPRMPDDVVGRIDAALAAEALLSATAPDTTATAPSPTTAAPEAPHTATSGKTHSLEEPVPAVEPDTVSVGATAAAPPHDGDRARVSRETSSPAVRPAGHAPSTTSGPGRKKRARSGRRRVAALGAVFAVAALGLGTAIVTSVNGGDSPGDPGQESALADTFSEEKLENRVSDLLSDDAPPSSGEASTAQSLSAESEDDPGNRVFVQPTVPSCVREGIGRDDAALATEEGVYQGHEVLLVVLPDRADTTRVAAYLVETACVTQPSLGAGDVLLKDSYPRS